jgi:PAS domain S-box-containing protein
VVGQDALSWLGVPLIVGDQVLGVMAVQSFTTPGLYGVRDRELLTAIANQVAIALQNTRQFEETEATLTDVQQSQKLLRTIIDSTPDWIFIKDQEHRYRLANQAYADSLHLTAEDFVGKNDLELGFPEDIVKGSPEKGIRGFWADDREVMDRGETKLVEVEPAVVDGQTIFLRTVKVPLRDEEGQVWGVLGFVSNITEREQLLSELEHRARREQTIREITEQMRAATSLEQLLSITACELGQRLSAGHTLVKLGLESSVVEGQVDNGHSN